MEEKKTVIEFDHVTKSYKLFSDDRKRLLSVFSKRVPYTVNKSIEDMSFRIREGDSVAFFGRNGAGKSTLLKMITGVVYPTEGSVKVDGRVSALLELSAGFDKEFTGRENIYFRGRVLGIPDKEIDRMVPAIISFAELGQYIDQPVRTYSSGMKARLGFAINVNIDPEILIVDESLSVGDRAFRKKCQKKIDELLKNHNITFLFVTHATKTAIDFCTRGIVLKSGKMMFDGPVTEAAEFYNAMIRDEERLKKKRKKRRKARREAAKKAALLAQQEGSPEESTPSERPNADNEQPGAAENNEVK